MVNDAELDTPPALDDLLALRAHDSAEADSAVTHGIQERRAPRHRRHLVHPARRRAGHGGPDRAPTIKDSDIARVTRPTESRVVRWERTPQQTQGHNVTTSAERDAEHALTEAGVVLLPQPADHNDRREEGAEDDA
ncbi:hypothetical protein [Streptomyces sp. NPDC005209]|uniref:hypothetical protein n=1 Tax=Streptomyces sp. NPDC005209 TaxID=3156715 RepID=UPI0033BE8984